MYKPNVTVLIELVICLSIGVIVLLIIVGSVTEDKKIELVKEGKEVLIKKVEIVPNTFSDFPKILIKATTEKPIQCGKHTTTTLYNNFSGAGHKDLLLPIAYPNRVFYLKNYIDFCSWDQSGKRCILENRISVGPVQPAKVDKKRKVGEVGLKPAFKFIF